MDRQTVPFDRSTPVIGMVHLPALPDAPEHDHSLHDIESRAVTDAERLVAGGVDGVLIENFGDAPFYPTTVPQTTIAAFTRIATAVRNAVPVPVGVNVLRNDATSALAIANAIGGQFIRVNVHTGARVTDQGVIEGQAHETLRLRDRLPTEIAIWADIAVKHSNAVANERSLIQQAQETIERGNADGVILSGSQTGESVAMDDLRRLRSHLDTVPLVIGSGVTAENAADILAIADGAIVGTAFKQQGKTTNPVSTERVRALLANHPETA